MKSEKDYCSLCGKFSKLCNSHILCRYSYGLELNDESGRHLRYEADRIIPVLEQDQIKMLMMCEECDSLFIGNNLDNRAARFAREVGKNTKEFYPWMFWFALSMVWRTLEGYYLELDSPNKQLAHNEDSNLILFDPTTKECLETWRKTLFNKKETNPNGYSIEDVKEDLKLGIVGSPTNKFSLHLVAVAPDYKYRGVAYIKLVKLKRASFVFIRMGLYCFIGLIKCHPGNRKSWYDSRIPLFGGMWPGINKFNAEMMNWLGKMPDVIMENLSL